MKEFVLASASPRRKKLLEMLGMEFKVRPSNLSEEFSNDKSPKEIVKELSLKKAKDVASKEEGIIIAADTIVVKNNNILGKPTDYSDAYNMLQLLNNESHQVLTGITIIKNDINVIDYKSTQVHFKRLAKEEITDYIATGEPFDKAGGYGIQAKGSLFVKKIDGCFYNVVGLPLVKLVAMLKSIGVDFRVNG